MIASDGCHQDWHDLGIHAPQQSAPNLSARMSVIRAQTSPRLQPGDQGDATPTASPLPGAASGPVAVEAAPGSIFAWLRRWWR